jgi:hypothetical protein
MIHKIATHGHKHMKRCQIKQYRYIWEKLKKMGALWCLRGYEDLFSSAIGDILMAFLKEDSL